ncbi:hypothetical protein C8Q70DRAFT_320149 [Cubamyces menziesii]|nr:hypothetical protein C8Q70DRAFT_320149 [Cubamyces menziesii]
MYVTLCCSSLFKLCLSRCLFFLCPHARASRPPAGRFRRSIAGSAEETLLDVVVTSILAAEEYPFYTVTETEQIFACRDDTRLPCTHRNGARCHVGQVHGIRRPYTFNQAKILE